ncbi:MAG: hypothetical protein U1A77_00185 [Pirellulales bacterium]
MSHDFSSLSNSQPRHTRLAKSEVADFLRELSRLNPTDETARAWAEGELKRCLGPQAILAYELPGVSNDRLLGWLGRRWWIWPDGIPAERRWSFPSSRLSRALDLEVMWFRRLQAICEETRSSGGRVVLAPGTAGERLVRRAAVRAGLDRLEVMIDERAGASFCWELSSQEAEIRGDKPPSVSRLWLSAGDESGCLPDFASIPVRDRALMILGEELRPIAVRARGHTARLLAARCVELPPSCRQRSRPRATLHASCSTTDRIDVVEPCFERATDEWPWPALVHWTRRREGPWPGQTEEQYIDELLDERPERDRSALAVLERIIAERRLRASRLSLRGGEPMVCWADVSPQTLVDGRVFRTHRHRWDFEPYGLAVRREWLQHCGARPVIYGDDAKWEELSEQDRPWFQRQGTRVGRRGKSIDWRIEGEWRVRGDVDLANVPSDSALVFVPDVAAARRIASISPWPVRIMAAAPLPESTQPA